MTHARTAAATAFGSLNGTTLGGAFAGQVPAYVPFLSTLGSLALFLLANEVLCFSRRRSALTDYWIQERGELARVERAAKLKGALAARDLTPDDLRTPPTTDLPQ